MTARGAIYVRVSTEAESQKDSPQHQVEFCLEYARTIGVQVLDDCIYNDAGHSGTELEGRSAVQQLVVDARRGKFDVVLFTAMSRFARDMADAFSLKKKLETIYGIRLVSIEEGYDSAVDGRNNEMVFTVHAMLAAHKSKEMSTAIQRGLRQSAKRGRHTGNIAPYGYVKGADKRLIADPATAQVVRRIFNLYLSGDSVRAIARRLNTEQIPTTGQLRGEYTLWQPSTITAILHNPAYVGNLVAHRWAVQQSVVDSRLHDFVVRRTAQRDEADWVIVENAHEPIVPKEAFERVQERMSRRRTGRGNSKPHPVNAFAGLLRCAECKASMTLVQSGGDKTSKHQYLVCGTVRRHGRTYCANHKRWRYDQVFMETIDCLRLHPLLSAWPSDIPTEVEHEGTTLALLAQEKRRLEMEERQNKRAQLENLRALQTGLFAQELIEQSQQQLVRRAKFIQEQLDRLTHREGSTDGTKGDPLPNPSSVIAGLGCLDVRLQREIFQSFISRGEFAKTGEWTIQLRF